MGGRTWLVLVTWVVTFGLVTWWVATEGEATAGSAAAVGAILASLLAFAVSRIRK